MKNQSIQLILVGCVALAALGGYLWWYRTVVLASSTLTALQEEIAANEKPGAPQFARSVRTRLETGEILVERYIVTEEEAPAFINDLEARGRAQGALVTTTSITTDGEGLGTILTFTLTVTGTFSSVMQTIGAIEYAPYALTISSVTLARDLDTTWQADLKVVVRATTPKP